MTKRIAFLGFPDNDGVAKALAANPAFGASLCMILEGTQEGALQAGHFLHRDVKSGGGNPKENILIVSDTLDEKVFKAAETVFGQKLGLRVLQSPVPPVMVSDGSGYGHVIYVDESLKPVQAQAAQSAQQALSQESALPQDASDQSRPEADEPIVRDAYTPEGNVSEHITNPSEVVSLAQEGGIYTADPSGTYTQELSESDRRRQLAYEIANSSFGSLSVTPITAENNSMIIWVTGVSGGSGKTTLSYLLASVIANAMQRKGLLNQRPVFVVEADFENSKWESRLNIEGGRNITHYIKRYSEIGRYSMTPKQRQRYIEDAIDGSTYVTDTGVRVIACPYNLREQDTVPVSKAIGQIVRFLREMDTIEPIIIVDGSYPRPSDIVSVAMANIANYAVLTSSNGNIYDIQRSLNVMTTELKMSKSRISLFYMKTTQEKFNKFALAMKPYQSAGFLIRVAELEDQDNPNGAWVGNLQPGPVLDHVMLNVAYSINNGIARLPELDDYVEYTSRKIAATPVAQARSWSPFGKKN